ncbi:MAG: M28 family peptidase [Planctomycetota bacterium]
MIGIGCVLAFLVLLGAALVWMTRVPGASYSGPLLPLTPEEIELSQRLHRHVARLAQEIGERHVWRPAALGAAAAYVAETLGAHGFAVREEPYTVEGRRTSNLLAELPGTTHAQEIVVVGAHYDTVPGCPGANDNASGVAALLEIAGKLREERFAKTVRFAAFVNEEPPFFTTRRMGSCVHARAARERGEAIEAMISIETVGFYRDEPGTQAYPVPLGLLYPSRGDFIAFVSNICSRSLLERAVRSFRAHCRFPSQGGSLPSWLPGVGWSDHWSFWQQGYPALMVTDTAPFRYAAYHTPEDTLEKLDFERLARVVGGLLHVVRELAE